MLSILTAFLTSLLRVATGRYFGCLDIFPGEACVHSTAKVISVVPLSKSAMAEEV